MCGIAGTVDPDRKRGAARVEILNRAQQHRGPDHSIIASIGGFIIGNTRLAIQDPGPEGNQPFVSADGRYHAVFNGEIYNHRDLVQRYRLPVRTACDGEVIPQLWAKLGPASLTELRGMYAIALVDCLQERLYLARDPYGIKPLYWRVLTGGNLAFASEVRSLSLIEDGIRINPLAIARYLHLGALAADQAPFLNVTALPPNSIASFGRDCRPVIRSIFPSGPLALSNGNSDFKTTIADSVELHLGADVPTVLLLSGGLDSATIAAVSRLHGYDLECMTVQVHGATDETGNAAATAKHYGHRFRAVPATLEDADVRRFLGAMQCPTVDGLNTYIVCKAVHEAGFKVALSGLGGDEVAGGYSHFRLLRYLPLLQIIDKVPSLAAELAQAVARLRVPANEGKVDRLLRAGGPRSAWQLSLLQREVLTASLASDLTGTRQQSWMDVSMLPEPPLPSNFLTMASAETAIYLQAMLLPDADTFSMASAVELRVPFVDTHVFAAGRSLPENGRSGPGKSAMARALGDPYLEKLAVQPKRGFSVPMTSWMTGPLTAVLTAANDSDAPIWSVVDRTAAQRAGLLPLRASERWTGAWALAVLNAWLTTASDGWTRVV